MRNFRVTELVVWMQMRNSWVAELVVWREMRHVWVTHFVVRTEMRHIRVTDLPAWTMDLRLGTLESASGASLCAALGHPVRWALVRELALADGATVPVTELAQRLGVKRSGLSNHLPQLLAAGVVAVSEDAAGDRRKRCLGLPASALREVSERSVTVDFGAVSVRFPLNEVTPA
jgi:DNA-binding MarR family transcriptional regulator